MALALRAMLRMFKFVPDKFVATLAHCTCFKISAAIYAADGSLAAGILKGLGWHKSTYFLFYYAVWLRNIRFNGFLWQLLLDGCRCHGSAGALGWFIAGVVAGWFTMLVRWWALLPTEGIATAISHVVQQIAVALMLVIST